jgi:hypothetical protein
MRNFSRLVAGAVTVIVAVTLSNYAPAQTKPPTTLPPPTVAEAADQLLKQMGAYIGSAEQFTFHADVTFDHLLPSGQKVQFSATEDVAVARPNKLYVEWSGDLGSRQFWYDGKSITLFDPDTPFYASDAAPPTIDGMLDKVITQLNFSPPLTDFLNSDPYQSVRGKLQYGFALGTTAINGRSCRSFAFVEKDIDWQIWIDDGPQLVPCKLVITYKTQPAEPQFSAVFSDWNFAPRIAAPLFTPDLPPGVSAIPFQNMTATASPK